MGSPVIVTLLIRGVISLGLLLGAILALWYGFRLFKNGAGLGSSHIVAEYGDFRVRANSIGAAVMVTAFGWASLVVWSAPSYSNGAVGVIEIASTGEMSIEGGPIDGYAEVAELFQKAAMSSENRIKLNDEPATIDLETLSQTVRFSRTGNFLIGAQVKNAKGNSVYTVFEASLEDDSEIRFRPVAVSEDRVGSKVADFPIGNAVLEDEREEG